MNTLQTNIKTMTSRELLNVINASRQLSGEPVTRLNKLNEKIVDELEGEHYTKRVVQNLNNTTSDIFELTIEQCTLIGMRESKSVRRSVLDKLKAMDNTPAIPQTYAAALLEAGRLAGIVEDQQAQLEIAAPKVEYHDNVLASTNGMTTSEVAGQLGMSAQKLNARLKKLMVQKKVGKRWMLRAKYLDRGLSTEETYLDNGGNSRHSMKWTEKGRKFIIELVG